MFTGLIEEVGHFVCLSPRETFFLISIEAPKTAAISKIGDSIAVNGCCLTVTQIAGSRIDFNLLQETLRCTHFSDLKPHSPVNCETSLTMSKPLGGHFVQGHVDTTGPVISTNFSSNDFRLEIGIPSGFAHYLIPKGSIALNGVSLTVARLKASSFVVWVIPHTLEQTNLASLKVGEQVNLEFDLLAKYMERMATCLVSKTPETDRNEGESLDPTSK